MSNNVMNIASTLQDCLTYNNRFASVKMTAEQLGAENFQTWNTLVKALHSAAYDVYVTCENNDLSVESKSVDKTHLYNALRGILVEIGEVNGHALYANEELATLCVGYAGKRGNSDSAALQLCMSKIRNTKKLLEEYSKHNGVDPSAITKLENDLEELEEEKTSLLENPDNRIKVPTRSNANAFRLEIEHRLARVITDQKAKTWAELEAEAEARRKERNKRSKERKNKKSKATTEATAK